jgi:flagellar hook-basal body complex protein FliE
VSAIDGIGPGLPPVPRLVRGPDLVRGNGLTGLEGVRDGVGDGTTPASDGPFDGFLTDALRQIDSLSDDVRRTEVGLLRGDQGVEIHDLQAAIGKSQVAFDLMLEIRNKMVEAWQTLSRSVM